MELPPGLAALQQQQKAASKVSKHKSKENVKDKTRDKSPKRKSKHTSKYKAPVLPKLDRSAKFRLHSERLNTYLTSECQFDARKKLTFKLPKKFFPRFDGLETKKHKPYEDDVLWIHQFSEGKSKEKIYRFNLSEVDAMHDLNWTMDGSDSSDDDDDDESADYEPPSFRSFLARTTDTTVDCDYICNDNEQWHLELDVNRNKRKLVLREAVFQLTKKK